MAKSDRVSREETQQATDQDVVPDAVAPEAVAPAAEAPTGEARTGEAPTGEPAAPAGDAPPPPAPAAYPQWRPQVPTYGGWEDAHGGPAPSDALRRAFAGAPAGDVVRDGLAALLLLLGLTLPWDLVRDGLSRLEVVVVTVLAIVALAAAYLARARAFGPLLDVRRAGLVRFVLAAPYLLVVLGLVLADLLLGGEGTAGGVGMGAAIGLAGAVLAVAPRAAELRPEGATRTSWTARIDRAWPTALGFLAGAAVLWVLAGLLVYVLGDAAELDSAAVLLNKTVMVLLSAAVLTLGAVGVLRRDEGWRLALVALAALPVLHTYLLGSGVAFGFDRESVHWLPVGLVWWPALAAAAAAPSARRAMRVTRTRWADATGRLLSVTVVVAAGALVATVLSLVEAGDDDRALWVLFLVLVVAYLAVAIGARTLVREGAPVPVRLVAAAVAGLVVFGAVTTTLRHAELTMVGYVDLLLTVVLPAALAGTLLAHVSSDARGVLGHAALPAEPVPAPAPPAVDEAEAVRLAQDPATPQAVLADLATRVPATRVHVARHPAAYPELLDWLAALGDPDVARAVAGRRQG